MAAILKNKPTDDKHSTIAVIPARLQTPPTGLVEPPCSSRKQLLPLGELQWEDFERLVYRLVLHVSEVEYCTLYGTQGENQQGIDLLARMLRTKQYVTYQCRRVKTRKSSDITSAVNTFLTGEWAAKSNQFVFCTSHNLRSTRLLSELENQRDKLSTREINFVWWGAEQLSLQLKEMPELVDDFFGREWVKEFVGKDAAEKLQDRFDLSSIIDFRSSFRRFYESVFSKHDPGLPTAVFSTLEPLGIVDRYVVPDIIDITSRIVDDNSLEAAYDKDGGTDRLAKWSDLGLEERFRTIEAEDGDLYTQLPKLNHTFSPERQSLGEWLRHGSRFLLVGDAGMGKSSLLRFLVLDLLTNSPSMKHLAPKWGSSLPVWLPFGLWTKLISAQPSLAPSSLEDALEAWFKSWSEQRLWELARKALRDRRALLLVDGLDEWSDEPAAHLALQILQVYVEQRDLAIIVTTRPLGTERLSISQWDYVVGEIAGLSQSQLVELGSNWFNWYFQRQRSSEENSASDERLAKSEATSLARELELSHDLSELAQNPLLFTLLIVLKLRKSRLPSNRFRAYDILVDQLLIEHPRRRRQAALSAGESIAELADCDVRNALAHLAFQIMESGSAGVVSLKAARQALKTYSR